MTDVEIVRAALYEAAKAVGFKGASLAPVPGDPVGDAHLALDRIELALKLIAQEAKDGRVEVTQGCGTVIVGHHDCVAPLSRTTAAPLGQLWLTPWGTWEWRLA